MSYFPMFIEMSGRRILVVGGGTVATRRIGVLLRFGASVTVVAQEVSDEVRKWSNCHKLDVLYGTYETHREALWGKKQPPFFMVLAATGQETVDSLVQADAVRMHAWFNMASDKRESDFYFPAVAESGPLIAGLISGGTDPALTRRAAGKIREALREIEIENAGKKNDWSAK